ncbi:MAG: hypothetical protein WBG86_17915 [Polyangiales bacterium]
MPDRPIPYDEMIRIPTGTSGALSIKHEAKPAGYEAFLAFPRSMLLGGQPAGRVKFDHTTVWHSLCEEGRGVWMTSAPVEQEQHWRALEDATGRVLVGGLGLGMAANILHVLDDVDEIVIVEKSQEVIDLVWEHTDRDKATIICADLHEWLELEHESTPTFDLAFYDIWQSDSERTFWDHVVPLRQRTNAAGLADEIVCWNEDVMLGQLAMSLHSRTLSFYGAMRGMGDGNSQRVALTAKTDSIWTEWSRPFFESLERHDVVQDAAVRAINDYLGMVAWPGRDRCWEIMADERWGS